MIWMAAVSRSIVARGPLLISSGDEASQMPKHARWRLRGRFAAGPRNGCVQVWWSGPAAIPAPPIPSDAEGNPACDIADRWEKSTPG